MITLERTYKKRPVRFLHLVEHRNCLLLDWWYDLEISKQLLYSSPWMHRIKLPGLKTICWPVPGN